MKRKRVYCCALSRTAPRGLCLGGFAVSLYCRHSTQTNTAHPYQHGRRHQRTAPTGWRWAAGCAPRGYSCRNLHPCTRARGLADCRPSARTSEADTLKNADGAPLHGGYYITPYIVFVGALFMLLSVLESKSI